MSKDFFQLFLLKEYKFTSVPPPQPQLLFVVAYIVIYKITKINYNPTKNYFNPIITLYIHDFTKKISHIITKQ